MSDLEQVIEDSVNDAVNDVPEVDVETAPDVEASTEEPVATEEPAAEEPASSQVAAPGAAAEEPAEPQDEFEKLAGVPQLGITGRENRIPYSRVKKITEKAVATKETEFAEAVLGRKLNAGEKPSDAVKTFVEQIPQLSAKVQDYETRLQTVGQFEQVMANEPQRFLEMLSGLPAYKDFFDFVRGAVAQAEGKGTTAAAPAQTVDPTAGMPEPDEELPDGSKVYSMEGLKALMEWNSQQTEARVSSKYESALKQLEERYKPVENEWRERQRIEQTLPVIRKQIEEARTWMLFNENEQEIIAALKADPRISLEGAYRQVVFPKLIAERNQMRQDVIKEVKAAPVSSSVTSRVTTRPGAPASGEPRSLTDIIKEQIDSLKR